MKRAALLVLALLSAAAEARAQDGVKGVVHRVKEAGETYEDLAEYYYGKRYLAHHVRLFNGRNEPLDRGLTLIIPTYVAMPVKKGQTLAAFAEANLSDPGRAEYLAELHNLKGKDRVQPKPGTRLRVVQSLKHVVRPGESLKSIARIYYRDVSGERLKLLALYNKMPDGGVRAGMALRIPLDSAEFSRDSVLLRMRVPFSRERLAEDDEPPEGDSPAPKRAERPKKRRERPKEEVAEAAPAATPEPPKPLDLDQELEALERLMSDGEYKGCEERAARALDRAPPAAVSAKTEILRLRAVSLIALGRAAEGKEIFRAVIKLDPEYDLDLYRTSPKVLEVFQAVAER